MTSEEPTTPRITPTENGPYMVENVPQITNQHGPISDRARSRVFLCRCGGSNSKPYCDGTHKKNGFNSDKLDGRTPDRRDDYEGEEVTIHDNRGICAHIGYCTEELAAVFNNKREPWIDPNAAGGERIITQVHRCPSGALSYSQDGVEHRDQEREPAIFVSPNGPYFVTGGPELLDTEVDTTMGEGASTEHYALCRCGGSKNKPFCDGTHWYINFTDEKN
ncbi:MAG: CDGSH iron-sulfur domain-containing protein [Chloroflexota bacterium]